MHLSRSSKSSNNSSRGTKMPIIIILSITKGSLIRVFLYLNATFHAMWWINAGIAGGVASIVRVGLFFQLAYGAPGISPKPSWNPRWTPAETPKPRQVAIVSHCGVLCFSLVFVSWGSSFSRLLFPLPQHFPLAPPTPSTKPVCRLFCIFFGRHQWQLFINQKKSYRGWKPPSYMLKKKTLANEHWLKLKKKIVLLTVNI